MVFVWIIHVVLTGRLSSTEMWMVQILYEWIMSTIDTGLPFIIWKRIKFIQSFRTSLKIYWKKEEKNQCGQLPM